MKNFTKRLVAVILAGGLIIGGVCNIKVQVLAEEAGWNKISAGGFHSMLIKTDGSLWVCGSNSSGQLGDGTQEKNPNYIKIMDNVKAVSAGTKISMAVKTDGSLWAWGYNSYGVLGDGTQDNHKLSPIKIMDGVVTVSARSQHALAVKEDGSLWAWGSNVYGNLGDGTTTNRLSPVKIMDGVRAVSTSMYRSLALKTDGSLWSLGNGGADGFVDSTSRITVPIKLMDGVKSMSSGDYHSMVLKTDGSVWTWGDNSVGQLGDGTKTSKNTPVKVMDGAKYISAGGSASAAIKTDGTLWIWGSTKYQGMIHQTTPSKFLKNIAEVSCGYSHSMAVGIDGTLIVWGNNGDGQFGNGKFISNGKTTTNIIDKVARPDSEVVSGTKSDGITIVFQGRKVELTLPLINNNGTTMYPFRECMEMMGAAVEWDDATKTAKGTLGERTVAFTVGSRQYRYNDAIFLIPDGTAPIVRDGRVYIPIRCAASALGFRVEWDGDTNTIYMK